MTKYKEVIENRIQFLEGSNRELCQKLKAVEKYLNIYLFCPPNSIPYYKKLCKKCHHKLILPCFPARTLFGPPYVQYATSYDIISSQCDCDCHKTKKK